MNALSLNQEAVSFRSRYRRAVGASIAAHAVLLAWLALNQGTGRAPGGLVEITWAEPEAAELSPAPPAAPETRKPHDEERIRPVLTASRSEARFPREETPAEVAVTPQAVDAAGDRLRERLSALVADAPARPTGLSVPASTIAAPGSRLARGLPQGIPSGTGPPVDLNREGTARGAPVALRRGQPGASGSSISVVKVSGTLDKVAGSGLAPAGSEGDSTAVRKLAGATLSGPVADRRLMSYGIPNYPAWAKKEAVEASVSLYFRVLPDGRVKENVLVQKTSGYEDFDRNAVSALLGWRFEPLGGTHSGEQWGAITFDYKLSDIR